MRMKFKVTHKHIRDGIHLIDENPLVWATCAYFTKKYDGAWVEVDDGFLVVRRNWERVVRRYRLPRSARKFMNDYHDRKPVKPFTFYLTGGKRDGKG